MTYGYAILSVLVIIVALAYFGLTKTDYFIPDQCVIDSGHGITCKEFSAKKDGIILYLKNQMNEKVTISEIYIVTSQGNCSNTLDQVIEPEQVKDFVISSCQLPSNKKIKGEILIDYKRNTLEKQVTGTLVTKVNDGSIASSSTNPVICQNAENQDLCDGLDIVFGDGYKQSCCNEYGLCC